MMLNGILNALKQSLRDNKYEWLGFAVGMVAVLVAAGVYRISWEIKSDVVTVPPSARTPVARPAATTQTKPKTPLQRAAPAPKAVSYPPTKEPAKKTPILERLDGPPGPSQKP